MWSESAAPHAMGGQTALTLDGVFFMPNAPFTFAGQGAQYQTTAQFVSRTLTASGQGTLKIKAETFLDGKSTSIFDATARR